MPEYRLPDLSHDDGALEPHVSGKIMELHPDTHHKTNVEGANTVLERLDDARHKSDVTRPAALERALAFHLSGHILHSLFWQNMMPRGGGQPDGELREAIGRDFGNFEQLKKQLGQAGIPLLVLDAWEHACDLQYQHRKTEFFDAIWDVWNWRDVAGRFRAARQLNVNLHAAAARR